jgi:hypothetical protein
MNVIALLAHKYADVGPIDNTRYSEPMLFSLPLQSGQMGSSGSITQR